MFKKSGLSFKDQRKLLESGWIKNGVTTRSCFVIIAMLQDMKTQLPDLVKIEGLCHFLLLSEPKLVIDVPYTSYKQYSIDKEDWMLTLLKFYSLIAAETGYSKVAILHPDSKTCSQMNVMMKFYHPDCCIKWCTGEQQASEWIFDGILTIYKPQIELVSDKILSDGVYTQGNTMQGQSVMKKIIVDKTFEAFYNGPQKFTLKISDRKYWNKTHKTYLVVNGELVVDDVTSDELRLFNAWNNSIFSEKKNDLMINLSKFEMKSRSNK